MKALLLMLLSVFVFSIYPVLAAKGLEIADPVAFVFMAHLGCAVFSFIGGHILLKRKCGAKTVPAGIFALDRKTWFYIIATGTAAAVNHSCLMYAFLKIPKISATVIYETWPIFAAWLTPVLVVKGWEQVRRTDYLFGLLAVAGIVLVVSADSRNFLLSFDFSAMGNMDSDRLLGYGLAVTASIGVCISTTLRRNVTRSLKEKYGDDLLPAVFLSSGLTRLAALPVFSLLFAFLYGGGDVFAVSALPLAVFTGVAVYLMGSVFYALSILNATDNTAPVPDFLAPIMAVTWLYLSGYTEVSDFVIIGGLFVITANLLVTVRAEDGFAYTASILTLLLSGAYCYFTTGEVLGDFYEAVSVSAVFYAILIAFAWDRVLDRTKREEELVLQIAYGLEALRRKKSTKSIGAAVRNLIAQFNTVITSSDRTLIGSAYAAILSTKKTLGESSAAADIYQDLDRLILSKTKDIMLSEVVLLSLIGGITFFGILGYRPAGLWPDMMGFIMAGAIVFIFFAIFDQLNERNRKLLSVTEDDLCILNHAFFESRQEFKIVTIVLIAIMLAVFYGLFKYKYMPL